MTTALVAAGPVQRLRDVMHARVEVPAVVRLLGLRSGGDVLLVGCGTGVAFEQLQRHLRPSSLVGIDLVLVGPGGHVGPAVVRADVRRLPFADASFDLVVDFGTCQHLSDRSGALAEIARVLRPGGGFVHELPAAQLIAHPNHFHVGDGLPRVVPGLTPERRAGLWAAHRRT